MIDRRQNDLRGQQQAGFGDSAGVKYRCPGGRSGTNSVSMKMPSSRMTALLAVGVVKIDEHIDAGRRLGHLLWQRASSCTAPSAPADTGITIVARLVRSHKADLVGCAATQFVGERRGRVARGARRQRPTRRRRCPRPDAANERRY